MPVSAGGFALFTQQDIGQFRRGHDLCHKLCISNNKIQKCQLCSIPCYVKFSGTLPENDIKIFRTLLHV